MDDLIAPLYLRQLEMEAEAPVAGECPVCFALVLTARLDDHHQTSHG